MAVKAGDPPKSESTHPAAFRLGLPGGLGEGPSPVTRQANELAYMRKDNGK